MITDPERFKHDRSAYERPGLRFRCGREGAGQKPCHQGPNSDGGCGGTSECVPFKNPMGRYECRRPLSAGGSCREGPRPDGTCSQIHPPCVPRLTLRAVRGRLALLAFSLVVSSIGLLLSFTRGGVTGLSPVDPGALTVKHAKSAEKLGCATCHASHRLEGMGWWKALFLENDLTPECVRCHSFEGRERQAHNSMFPERKNLPETTCVMCHTEHKGREADLTPLKDAQCNTCHTVQFPSFSKGHPEFPGNFPHDDRIAIQFDHASHLNRYFKDPKFSARAPQACLNCHAVESSSQREVRTGGFEENCASCHASEISQKDLVLFRWPQITTGPVEAKSVLDSCGSTKEGAPGTSSSGEGKPFEGVSFEEPTDITTFLLGIDSADPDSYSEPIKSLAQEMIQQGPAPIARLLGERSGASIAAGLLRGLNPEVVKQAACAWAQNLEYESASPEGFNGWYADLLELKYKPGGHADPVAKNWLEFGLLVSDTPQDAVTKERADRVRTSLLSRIDGVGRCAKCHAVSSVKGEEGKERLGIEWRYHRTKRRPQTTFSHGAHLNLFPKSEACTTCHLLNPSVDFKASFKNTNTSDFVSSFHSIKRETCLQCHGGGKVSEGKSQVRQDCTLCHVYHTTGFGV